MDFLSSFVSKPEAEYSLHSSWMGRHPRVLVTGGCGFIGSHLVERLVSLGARVSVLDNMQSGDLAHLEAVRDVVHMVEGDVRNASLVARLVTETAPQLVFHLAANASVPGSVENPAYDFETNCQGTFVLLDALRKVGTCEKFVLASSGAVYGEPIRFPICEADLLAPISPYGASKFAAETEARMFGLVYGMPVVIARIFNVYGPRMSRFVIFDFLNKLKADSSFLEVLGTGKQVRDFTFVSDTVDGLLTLGVAGQAGEAYNVSSGVSYSVTELAHAILNMLDLVGKTQIVYTGRSWAGDAQHWEVNIQKMGALGYRPKVSLSCGLEATIDWFESMPTALPHSLNRKAS